MCTISQGRRVQSLPIMPAESDSEDEGRVVFNGAVFLIAGKWCSMFHDVPSERLGVNTSECMVIIHVAYGDGHVLWGSIRPRESFWTCHVPRVLLPSSLGQLYLHRNRARVGKSDHCRVQHNGPQVTLSEMLRWGEKWWEELSGS